MRDRSTVANTTTAHSSHVEVMAGCLQLTNSYIPAPDM